MGVSLPLKSSSAVNRRLTWLRYRPVFLQLLVIPAQKQETQRPSSVRWPSGQFPAQGSRGPQDGQQPAHSCPTS